MPSISIQVDRDLPAEGKWIDVLSARSLSTGSIAPALRTILIAQAAGVSLEGGGNPVLFDPEAVFQTIRILESRSKSDFTKGPIQYDKGPLQGLWRKHVFQAGFLIDNILAEMNKQKGVSRLVRAFNDKYGKDGWQGRNFSEEDAELLARIYSRDGIEDRAARRRSGRDGGLTGEYLIFGRTKRFDNRYLWLATHKESQESIWQFVKYEVETSSFHLKVGG